MQVRVVVVTPFQQNCSVIWCQETMKGAVVDPGGDLEQIEAAIKESGAEIEQVVVSGLYTAFSEQRRLDDPILAREIQRTVPLSATARERIQKLQAWAAQRAVPAD